LAQASIGFLQVARSLSIIVRVLMPPKLPCNGHAFEEDGALRIDATRGVPKPTGGSNVGFTLEAEEVPQSRARALPAFGLLTKVTRKTAYGTLRVYGASRMVISALCERAAGEGCTQIYYSREYKQHMARLSLTRGTTLNPELSEWRMGVPRNWSSPLPLVCPGPRPKKQMLNGILLSTGLGMLDHGLHDAVRFRLRCEMDSGCRKVLRARMRENP